MNIREDSTPRIKIIQKIYSKTINPETEQRYKSKPVKDIFE